jgi:NAD(P)-dependent dehydrogenase (short-subunit alcohol dehydrogenase family)
MAQKTALVTGAAQGIGAAIAALLAERGYEVAVADVKNPG